MEATTHRPRPPARPAQRRPGQALLAQPGRTGRRPRRPGNDPARVSHTGRRVDRPDLAPAVSGTDGSVAHAGRAGRLHPTADGDHHALRPPAGKHRAGQAALLRHVDAAGGICHRLARRKPRGPADQDRGQSAAPRQPRSNEPDRPGRHPWPLRPRPGAGRHFSRPAARLGRRGRGTARPAASGHDIPRKGKLGGQGRRHPQRHHWLADAEMADRRVPRPTIPRRNGLNKSPSTATTPRPAREWPLASLFTAGSTWRRPTSSSPWTPTSSAAVRRTWRTRARLLSRAAGQDARQGRAGGRRRHESALRHRDRPDHHRSQGGPSPCGASVADRGFRPRPCRQAGRCRRCRRRRSKARQARWVEVVAKDLQSHKPGTTLVLAGDAQPPAVHAIVAAINHKLDNIGKTVIYTEPLLPDAAPTA